MRPDYKFYLRTRPQQGAGIFTNGSDNVLWGGDWYQVYPGMDRSTSIVYDIDKHKHRRLLSGDLWFTNREQDDYTLMTQINTTSAKIEIRIEDVTGASDFWEGYYSINDGKWDADRGIMAVQPAPDDEYRFLEAEGDKEFNMIEASGGLAPVIDYDGGITEYTITSGCTAYNLQAYLTNNPSQPETDGEGVGDVWNNYAYVGDTGIGEGCGGGTSHYYTWKKYTSPIRINENFFWSETFGNYYLKDWNAPSGTITLNARAFTLTDAIEYIVSNIIGIVPYESDFFKDATNYVLDEFFPGEFATNPLNYILIYQKSDVKTTSDPATRAMLTFNDLMMYIENTFNAFWFIDPDGNFRIEHESYFTKDVDLDLTTFDGGYWITNMNKWTYERDKMPSREHFEWMEVSGVDFAGLDIIYNNLSLGNKYSDSQKDRILPITTDINYVYSNESDISNDGWVFLQTDSSYNVENEEGYLTKTSQSNGHLSWANLHDHYWKHGRVLEVGDMNGENTSFSDIQRNIKQIEITYPTNTVDFDPEGLKTTELGNGEVGEAEYILLDGTVRTVFFYPNLLSPPAPKLLKGGFPPEESFLIKTTGIWYLLKDIDKVKWYG